MWFAASLVSSLGNLRRPLSAREGVPGNWYTGFGFVLREIRSAHVVSLCVGPGGLAEDDLLGSTRFPRTGDCAAEQPSGHSIALWQDRQLFGVACSCLDQSDEVLPARGASVAEATRVEPQER